MEIAGGTFLLTGGASLIGSHLTEQLLEAGAGGVILFDNFSLGSPEVAAFLAQDPRVRLVRGDITRLHELLQALDRVDGVFALAGFLTLPLSQNPGLGLDVNVRGMFNVVEACRFHTVKKVVFSSSVATFGDPEVESIDDPVSLAHSATGAGALCLEQNYRREPTAPLPSAPRARLRCAAVFDGLRRTAASSRCQRLAHHRFIRADQAWRATCHLG
jgi:UDP-glucose 4-epimerase